MNRLALFSLAATALIPASAIAEGPSGAAPGVTWQQRAPMAHQARSARHHAVRPGDAIRHHERVNTDVRRGEVITHRRGDRIRGGHHVINQYPHYRRVDRGFVLPQSWWGPAFHIGNWGAYGLPQPMHGSRWVRYYDDALLIDGYGRVHDGRWGMKWDEYGDEWGYDERGIPIYVGNGDFHPDDEDYAWVEGHDGYAEGYPYGHQQGAYGQAGYGYGYGYGYGAVVTETTVTTSPTVITETHYVDEVTTSYRQPHRARAQRSKTIRCNC